MESSPGGCKYRGLKKVWEEKNPPYVMPGQITQVWHKYPGSARKKPSSHTIRDDLNGQFVAENISCPGSASNVLYGWKPLMESHLAAQPSPANGNSTGRVPTDLQKLIKAVL